MQTEKYEYVLEDGRLTEKNKQTGEVREIGRGEIVGFGIFTGLCEEEEPNIFSDDPETDLQLFFKKTSSSSLFDFVSEPLTAV